MHASQLTTHTRAALGSLSSNLALASGSLTLIEGGPGTRPDQLGWQMAAGYLAAGRPVTAQLVESVPLNRLADRMQALAPAPINPGLIRPAMVDPGHRSALLHALARAIRPGAVVLIPQWSRMPAVATDAGVASLAALADYTQSSVVVCAQHDGSSPLQPAQSSWQAYRDHHISLRRHGHAGLSPTVPVAYHLHNVDHDHGGWLWLDPETGLFHPPNRKTARARQVDDKVAVLSFGT